MTETEWEWDDRAQERLAQEQRVQSGVDEQDELDREYEADQEHAQRMHDQYED